MTSKNTFIYALRDPRDYTVRYIGKSNDPEARLQAHMKDKKSNPIKTRWIDELLAEKLEPELEILENVVLDEWQEAEIKWIAKGREEGWPLTNITDGGDGTTAGWRNLSDFIYELIGGDFAKEYSKLSFEKQKEILVALAKALLPEMSTVQNAYRYFGIDMPVIDDPLVIGWQLIDGNTKKADELDIAIDEMSGIMSGYMSYIHGID